MTISLKAFESEKDGIKTTVMWHSSGSASLHRKTKEKDSHVYVYFTPKIFKEIAVLAQTAKDGEKFYDTGNIDFPGMFPDSGVVMAERKGDEVVITRITYSPYGKTYNPRSSSVTVTVSEIIDLANTCINKMQENSGMIRPIFWKHSQKRRNNAYIDVGITNDEQF